MIHLTERDVEHALARMRAVHERVSGLTSRGEDVMGAAIGQTLSGVAALGSGYAIGRWGPIKVGSLEADLLASAGLHGAAFFGLFGKASQAAHSVAQGLGDGFLHRVGVGMGDAHRVAGASPISVSDPKGSFHVGQSPPHASIPARRPVTQAEIVQLTGRPAR